MVTPIHWPSVFWLNYDDFSMSNAHCFSAARKPTIFLITPFISFLWASTTLHFTWDSKWCPNNTWKHRNWHFGLLDDSCVVYNCGLVVDERCVRHLRHLMWLLRLHNTKRLLVHGRFLLHLHVSRRRHHARHLLHWLNLWWWHLHRLCHRLLWSHTWLNWYLHTLTHVWLCWWHHSWLRRRQLLHLIILLSWLVLIHVEEFDWNKNIIIVN